MSEVSYVIRNSDKSITSQFYIRPCDAIKRASVLNSWYAGKKEYSAVTGKIVDVKYCKGFEQEPKLIELELT